MIPAIWFLAVLLLVSATCAMSALIAYRIGWRDAKEDGSYAALKFAPWDVQNSPDMRKTEEDDDPQ